jgi:hypothetical protein
MPGASSKQTATSIDDVAQLLSRIVDAGSSPLEVSELTDEISQLLWAITDLDPDGELLLKHSGYVADLATRTPD